MPKTLNEISKALNYKIFQIVPFRLNFYQAFEAFFVEKLYANKTIFCHNFLLYIEIFIAFSFQWAYAYNKIWVGEIYFI